MAGMSVYYTFLSEPMECRQFAVEEVGCRSLHQSLSGVTLFSFQDGIYWLRNFKQREAKSGTDAEMLFKGQEALGKAGWPLDITRRRLGMGKPQEEVTPCHMTRCDIPLGFTMRLD